MLPSLLGVKSSRQRYHYGVCHPRSEKLAIVHRLTCSLGDWCRGGQHSRVSVGYSDDREVAEAAQERKVSCLRDCAAANYCNANWAGDISRRGRSDCFHPARRSESADGIHALLSSSTIPDMRRNSSRVFARCRRPMKRHSHIIRISLSSRWASSMAERNCVSRQPSF
jgi:hypothetical protein